VVSTECPSGPDEILDGGRIGQLIPMGDDQVLAEALAATLDAPLDRDLLRRHVSSFTASRAVDGDLEALAFAPAPAGARSDQA
jgi:glycosyltransferase involved in cell wall biosynthesis